MSSLWILGMSLNEFPIVSKERLEILKDAKVIIGESRKTTFGFLKKTLSAIPTEKVYLLDPFPENEKELLWTALEKAKKNGDSVVLFSDCGMPVLFDPGKEILERAKSLGFKIRCEPGPTSFGTACALSGYSPPFLVYGFLPQETQKRALELNKLAARKETILFMETPYRFIKLLEELKTSFGEKREFFLAWNISLCDELYFWGTLKQLSEVSKKNSLSKGEFILIAKG